MVVFFVEFFFFATLFVFFGFLYIAKRVVKHTGFLGVISILLYTFFVSGYLYLFFDKSFNFVFDYSFEVLIMTVFYFFYVLSLIINYVMDFPDNIVFYLSLNSLSFLAFGVVLIFVERHFSEITGFVGALILVLYLLIRIGVIVKDYFSGGVFLLGFRKRRDDVR